MDDKMDEQQFRNAMAQHEPVEHERQTTDEEYEAGADFAGIAERIELMVRLGDDGWWGDAGSWNGEDETLLRVVGPVFARAADSEAAWSGSHDYSPTADLLEATAWQLDFFNGLVADESSGLSDWAERTMRDLFALAEAIERFRAREIN